MSAWADNPQAAQIDALIARAEQLTPVECDRLTEAAVRAQFAAAAGVAAGAAAAAGDAARVAAWFGAWTVGALVVRDLIEEGTPWDWAAYDVLTGPWRRVIGPIHPDDEVLR